MKFICFFLLASFSFLSFEIKSGNGTIIYYVETIGSDQEARNLQSELTHGYTEKITSVTYNLSKKQFAIDITDNFNKVEILGFFRDRGHEAYCIQNNIKYSLNLAGNDVNEQQVETKDENLLKK